MKVKSEKHILIVEDFDQQLQRYVCMAKELGMIVHIAMNLEKAIWTLTNERVDILLTDIHLTASIEQNTFEGFELLKTVQAHYPEVLPMVMSSDPKVETYRESMTLGACHYMKKPIISVDELKIAVQAAYDKRESLAIHKRSASHRVPRDILLKAKDGDFAIWLRILQKQLPSMR